MTGSQPVDPPEPIPTDPPPDESPASQPEASKDEALYAAVAARRLQWDNMIWQVPTLSLTGQAFLFTITLGPDSSRIARIISSVLSIAMTILSMHLMSRHRQAEWTDAHWLEDYEKTHFGRAWHGRTWAIHRNSELGSGWLSKFPGFQVWMTGLATFGLAAVAVLIITAFWPHLLA